MTYTLLNLRQRLPMHLVTTNGSTNCYNKFLLTDHGITAGDIILLDNFSTATNY